MKLFLLLLLFGSVTVFCQNTIPEDWKLSSKQASKMMQYFKECKGDCFTSKAKPDTAKENYIRAIFPNAKTVTWENARYRAEDASRYASRNWQSARVGGGQVTGYTTRIMKVVDADDSVYFFDIASICPPPSICDSISE